MREETFTLPLGDGFSIHGRVNYGDDYERSDRAIIFCHGLTGHMYEHLYMTSRVFFAAQGFDTIRFNFYSDEPDARRITDCTVALHAEDLKKMLAHFAERYHDLFVVGHSYGGLAILLANSPQVTAASLWDGTFIPFAEHEGFSASWFFNKELSEHMVSWQPTMRVIGTKFYEESRAFTCERMTAWAQQFTKPVQVLAAGAFLENVPYQEKMFNALGSADKEFVSIDGASHGFNEGDAVFDLLENTLNWFERFDT
jgi:pimeloyl-ACP methyl ester carboxylesterase